ncbi:MAG TPA: hypothetical protein ENI62_14145 [Gammaproteobacteria bacterium]|nr:hypothetical protein [Gammaproteobacteria bacterium]
MTNPHGGNTDEILGFLDELLRHTQPIAEQEWRQLQAFAKRSGQLIPIQAWDIAYLSEQLKKQQFHFTDEELRPYFPLPKVLAGLFSLVQSLYGIQITPPAHYSRR